MEKETDLSDLSDSWRSNSCAIYYQINQINPFPFILLNDKSEIIYNEKCKLHFQVIHTRKY